MTVPTLRLIWDERVGALCCVCCQAYRDLTVRFLFLRYSAVCSVKSLSLFISFLYLDLSVLGDDSWISSGSFMRTKHICALIHIRIKGEVGTVKLV